MKKRNWSTDSAIAAATLNPETTKLQQLSYPWVFSFITRIVLVIIFIFAEQANFQVCQQICQNIGLSQMTQWTDEWTGFDRKFTHPFSCALFIVGIHKKFYTKKSQNYTILSGFIISLQTITVTAAQLDLPGVWEDKQTRGKGRQRSLNRRWWWDYKLWPILLNISVFDVNYVNFLETF